MSRTLVVLKDKIGTYRGSPLFQAYELMQPLFQRMSISYDLKTVGEIKEPLLGYDLIVYLGGDTGFLRLAPRIQDTPILSVRISKGSASHFSAVDLTQGPQSLEQMLTEIRSNSLVPQSYSRMMTSIDGKETSPCLNDVFIGNRVPHKETHCLVVYRDAQGQTVQSQLRNFGFIVSTGAGSTAWVRTAGGIEMDPTSSDIQLVSRQLGNGYCAKEGLSSLVIQDPYPRPERYPAAWSLQEDEDVTITLESPAMLHLFNRYEKNTPSDSPLKKSKAIFLSKGVSFEITTSEGLIHVSNSNNSADCNSYVYLAPERATDVIRLSLTLPDGSQQNVRCSGILYTCDHQRMLNRNRDNPFAPLVLSVSNLISLFYNPRSVGERYDANHGLLCIDGHVKYSLPRSRNPPEITIESYAHPLQVYHRNSISQ